MELTVPFACKISVPDCPLDLSLFIPDNGIKECMLSSIGYVSSTNKGCGIRFYNNDVNQKRTFTLRSIPGDRKHTSDIPSWFEVILKTKPFSSHRMFGENILQPIRVSLLRNIICLHILHGVWSWWGLLPIDSMFTRSKIKVTFVKVRLSVDQLVSAYYHKNYLSQRFHFHMLSGLGKDMTPFDLRSNVNVKMVTAINLDIFIT